MTDGQRIGDRYELGEVLGRGGMAEVHLGRDVRLGRTVAVKTLRADLARDPTFQARFRREAQSAASLNHPSVVAVYDTGEDLVHGVFLPFIVMEFVEGQTLRELMNDGRRLLPERALEITAGVLRALEYSHRAGIIHRDIKPGNVMLTGNGEVKVMDFGIARAVADSSSTVTQTAAVIGTAQYLSPEQARGTPVDARSDLYSTGCLLYELLTGRPPFTGDSAVAVAYQHVREDPVPPSSLDPDVGDEIDAIVMKALAKNPENRYQDAGEMRVDIERALAGQPVTAPTVFAGEAATQMMGATSTLPPAPAGPRRQEKRRTTGYVLLGLAAVAVFALAAVLGVQIFGGSGKKVQVPNLSGLTEKAAVQSLKTNNLKEGKVTHRFSNAPQGHVVDQRPAASATLEQGGTVDLVLSKGSKDTTVPDLVGKSRQQATTALQDVGLQVGQTSSQPSGEAKDTVLSSSPGAGSTASRGDQVDLVLASGQNTVPNVVNQSKDAAAQTLKDAGFKVSVEHEQSDVPPDTVLRQSQPDGKLLDLGTTVTITVSQAPPQPTTTAPPTTAPPTTTPPTSSPGPTITLPGG